MEGTKKSQVPTCPFRRPPLSTPLKIKKQSVAAIPAGQMRGFLGGKDLRTGYHPSEAEYRSVCKREYSLCFSPVAQKTRAKGKSKAA